MNFTKNALVLLTAIAIVAIYTAYTWCNELVAVSLLKAIELPVQPQIAKYRSANKAVKSKPDYAAMTIRELKKLCKGTKIKGWEKLRKAELIMALAAL